MMVRRDEAFLRETYYVSVAVPAKRPKIKSFEDLTPVQQTTVRLFADGKSRSVVARMLAPHMYPAEYHKDRSLAHRLTRKKIRTWEESQWFRDLVYNQTMVHLDTQLPTIMKGMASRARKRVDAARLVLEVTGRHNPRGESAAPAQINISFGGQVPRPSNRAIGPAEEDIVDGEVLEEDE